HEPHRSGRRAEAGLGLGHGLPLGVGAAIVVGRTVSSTFTVRTESGRPLPIGVRVPQAVAEAETGFGAPPAAVRLVCIDDGSDGDDIAEIHEWLEQAYAIRLLVLDLVAPIARSGSVPGTLDPASHADAMSVARACEAALW
ncbi:MAG: hypothetical protein AAGK32_04900, partial [Actinomycetota bacterium]